MAFKKKLYANRPNLEARDVEVKRTSTQNRQVTCTQVSIDRQVRQSLADKVCGTKVGLWLLIPEHLRLGSWDLLSHWAGPDVVGVDPRLAMQMVNESALCVTGIRAKRSLTQSDFALAGGLPYVATDSAIHNMLEAHTVAQAEHLQVALGKIRLCATFLSGSL